MSHVVVPMSDEGISLDALTYRRALRLPRWGVWTFSLAIVLTYSCLLGGYGLGEPDEPRYAEIPREMIELGDWATPHLNYVKYFEKPPFVYWLTAINFTVFGTSEFVARLWPALFGLIGIVMVQRLGRSMYGVWTGYAAAAVLAASPFYFGLSQILILDMPLTALMTLALGAFWFAYRGVRHRWALVLLLYAATACAVLTKGPVAALLNGGIIVAFLVLRSEWSALRWLLSPLAIVLFLVITLPWFMLVSQRNPEFLNFFIVDQHLRRFLSPNEHQQGPWFFIPIVWGGMLPWSGFVLFAPSLLRQFVARLLQRRVSAATLFCVVWSGVIFAFFSLSGSKLATYILPMFCPLAILAARFFQRVLEEGQVQVLARGCVALLVLAILAALGGAVAGAVVDLPQAGLIVPRTYVGACIVAGFAGTALVLVRRQACQASFVVLLLGMLALQAVAISGREVVPQYRALGMAIRQQAQPQDQVILYHHYVQGIPFYAERRVVVVGGRGELDFGSHQGDQSAFFWNSDQSLLDAWQSPRRVFLVIDRLELDPLRPRLDPAPRQIAAKGKKVVIVNFAR
jgi:4-amino-4-deoxy-L-arabinose transferase-like glycosyltransferase